MGECERVTGALEHIGDRVRHLVYLDALVPGDGDRPGATAGGGAGPGAIEVGRAVRTASLARRRQVQ